MIDPALNDIQLAKLTRSVSAPQYLNQHFFKGVILFLPGCSHNPILPDFV
jgi:hypothetical protein